MAAVGSAEALGQVSTRGSARTEERAGRAAYQVPVGLPQLYAMYATRGGLSQGALPGSALDACNQTSARTSFDFQSGGNAVAQGGFVEDEIAATQYVIDASDFPIKIKTAEFLLSQNHTNPTTTEWTVMVWQGPPSTGQLLGEFSSDGVVLPHASIAAGQNNALIVFQIDPSDPEQIVIQDNPTHSFTIGLRIDEHNNQTGSGCTSAPPANANAFPTTDIDGLQHPSFNWLMGLNCGPFGCPPNGGWVTFQNLASVCRPSGDWVMRATWDSINCAPGAGACCLPDGTCQATTIGNCSTLNGAYQGDGTSCSTVSCPIPTGACCFSSGSCLTLQSGQCATAGGVYQGNGTQCGAGNTCPLGACCLPNGTCTDGLTTGQCTAQGGTFRGAGTTCAGGGACPQPSGACCVGTGCLSLTQSDCAVIPGVWAGPGTQCATPNVCVACYPNCDGSTEEPRLNVLDFNCFLNNFTNGTSYANCDNSTGNPSLTVLDFNCFINRFNAGCP